MKNESVLFYLSSLNFFFFFIIITIHVGFLFIPAAVFIISSLLWNFKVKLWEKLFFIFIPVASSLSYFSKIQYPFNYFQLPVIFFWGGLIFKYLKEKRIENSNKNYSFLIFLYLTFLSMLFVYLKWFNIGIKSIAILKDTPIAPTGERLSFGVLFPSMVFLIYSTGYFVLNYFFYKKDNEEIYFKYLSAGYIISLIFSILQKFELSDIFVCPFCKSIKQFNGMFSDFNGLGTFSGILFFWAIYLIKRKLDLYKILILIATFFGSIISGSRSSFLIIAFAISFFIFKTIKEKKNIRISLLVLIVFLFGIVFFGGKLKTRLFSKFKYLKAQNLSLEKKLDLLTNGRISMLKFGANTILSYPVSGIGTGNHLFYLRYKNYAKKYLYDLPLNQYLLIVEEGGIFALLLFLLFLFNLAKHSNKSFLFITIFIVFIFNSALWLPEISLIFFALTGLTSKNKKNGECISYKPIVLFIIFFLFILFNILNFKKLHPITWAKNTKTLYDYGFYYKEKLPDGQSFKWTKGYAGIFIYNENLRNKFKELKLFCGAPLNHLKYKTQTVHIYFNGELIKSIVFKENIFKKVNINFNGKNGFLEFIVKPAFNLKKMNIGIEPRTLGIQIYNF